MSAVHFGFESQWTEKSSKPFLYPDSSGEKSENVIKMIIYGLW